jgi:predicted Zn-dependent protease
MTLLSRLIITITVGLVLTSCGGANLFTVEDDKALGEQLAAQIESDPATYPLLSESEYSAAYAYLRGMRDKILASGEVNFSDEFVWEVYIIEDDDVLNAFAAPGGYLYFYTGLIKFLDTEDDFEGVMGHEIAHAAERHTTEALTRRFGVGLLLDILLGNNLGALVDIAEIMGDLAFSRADETEADEKSVEYLDPTEYQCNGAAGFFQKLLDEDQAGGTPEFLSTHPSPENRVENINAFADELACEITPSGNDYQAFKDMLP